MWNWYHSDEIRPAMPKNGDFGIESLLDKRYKLSEWRVLIITCTLLVIDGISEEEEEAEEENIVNALSLIVFDPLMKRNHTNWAEIANAIEIFDGAKEVVMVNIIMRYYRCKSFRKIRIHVSIVLQNFPVTTQLNRIPQLNSNEIWITFSYKQRECKKCKPEL